MRFGETAIPLFRAFRRRVLLSSFSGKPSDVFRAVHHLRDNSFFFESYSKDFFYQLHELLQQRKTTGVRRLLVYANSYEKESEESRRIIEFHSQTPGYSCVLIADELYRRIILQCGIDPRMDFALYGEQRVFRARVDKPDFVLGTWSSKKSEIEKYVRFFDICWNSPSSIQIPSVKVVSPITLEELFSIRERD